MAIMHQPVTVYKVGGSLFRVPDFPQRLNRLLSRQKERYPLMIAGGGATADLVREWDRQFDLGEEQAHRLAMHSLSLNSELLRLLIPKSQIVTNKEEAEAVWVRQGVPILDTLAYINANETESFPLPHTWEVTSDSIAAWVTIRWPADQLVLLKSVELPEGISIADACKTGLVDPFFIQFADNNLCVNWLNFNNAQDVMQNCNWIS